MRRKPKQSSPKPVVPEPIEYPELHHQVVVMADESRSRSGRQPFMMVFALFFAGIGTYAVLSSFAAKPTHSGGSTGQLSANVTQDWTNDPGGYIAGTRMPPYKCFGTDDYATWKGAGTLAPGETYTFTPNYPTCTLSEHPSIIMHVDWTGATQLKEQTTYPFDAGSDINHNSHLGQAIVARVIPGQNSGQQANLCMLNNVVGPSGGAPVSWSVTITNTGSQTATVNLSGFESNGWASFTRPSCILADADGDHWNDELEANNLNSDYLFPGPGLEGNCAGCIIARASPADLNMDGVIDQKDVDLVSAHLGETWNGCNSYDPNYASDGQPGVWGPNAASMAYDLDCDGHITQHDVDEVKALIGKPIPLDKDYLAPWAVVTTPATVLAGSSSFKIGAFASDNDLLTHVDFSVGGSLLCSNWQFYSGYNGGGKGSNELTSCAWRTVPKRAGVATQVQVTAYDAAGLSYSTTQTITTQ